MKKISIAVATGALALAAVQLIPYGRDHNNPPVHQVPQWSGLETRELAQRACFDCHSNETTWPWYSSLAPVSWVIERDVYGGRSHLNFSEWDLPQKEAEEAATAVRKGEMPPRSYVALHPGAWLNRSERALLIEGLQAITNVPSRADKETRELENR
jgi:hypothetical protein